MPEAHNSFHTNWPEDPVLGYNMYDYFFSERMPAIHNRFPASDKPEDNFIAGNFMGGLGTIKCCGRTIRKICGCGGAVRSAGGFYPACRRQLCRKYQSPVYPRQRGLENTLASPDNVWAKLKENKEKLPPLYFACGTADAHYTRVYLPFKAYAEKEQLPIPFRETEGYDHERRYWDMEIRRAHVLWPLIDD